jgi:hypothetical protein
MICHTCITGPVCVGRIVLLCTMCFGELMSHGAVDFMSSFMRVRVGDSVGVWACFVWLCRIIQDHRKRMPGL